VRASYIKLKSRRDEHLPRKFFHIISGTVAAFLFATAFDRNSAIAIVTVATLLLGFYDLLRLKYSYLNSLAMKLYAPLMREGEDTGPSAQFYYLLGMCFAIIFLPKTLAIQAILTLAWMDPVAAFVGLKWGRRSWNSVLGKVFVDTRAIPLDLGAKTVEGSFAGFFVASLAGVIAWTGPWAAVSLGGSLWWPAPGLVILYSFTGAFVAMIAEAWPTQWDDNANIPFWTGLLLWALTAALNTPLNFNN